MTSEFMRCCLDISPTHHTARHASFHSMSVMIVQSLLRSLQLHKITHHIYRYTIILYYICLSRRRRHCALATLSRVASATLPLYSLSFYLSISIAADAFLPSGAEGFPAARLWSIFWWLITFQSFLDNYFYHPFKQIALRNLTHTQLRTHVQRPRVRTSTRTKLQETNDGWSRVFLCH